MNLLFFFFINIRGCAVAEQKIMNVAKIVAQKKYQNDGNWKTSISDYHSILYLSVCFMSGVRPHKTCRKYMQFSVVQSEANNMSTFRTILRCLPDCFNQWIVSSKILMSEAGLGWLTAQLLANIWDASTCFCIAIIFAARALKASPKFRGNDHNFWCLYTKMGA